MAHTVFAPNDIPLLDNRFRIDPATEQATFILNHSKGEQRIVLVQPDGSKLYQQRHPETVSWVSGQKQDIITVQKPMPGPWQAIANLDGDNRIKIISDVELVVNRLPLKLYAQEYITTNATLYADNKLMDNAAYLDDAKLSISLVGNSNKKMALYKDDGKHYDELPFDGKLTARLFVDLPPARYLLNIRTQNDVFIRNVNKDAVVFIRPITYKTDVLETESDNVQITFKIDLGEIDPNSVSINGLIKDVDENIIEQVLINRIDNISESPEFSSIYQLPYGSYSFSGKAYATSLDGRELELQLKNSAFDLVAPFVLPEIIAVEPTENEEVIEIEPVETSIFSNLWVLIAIASTIILLLAGIIFFVLKRKKKKAKSDEEEIQELNLDELQPMPIDLSESK
jgi:uncharacterized protein (TIGR03503 family)